MIQEISWINLEALKSLMKDRGGASLQTMPANRSSSSVLQTTPSVSSGMSDARGSGTQASGACAQKIYVPSHTRSGKSISAYERLCGRTHSSQISHNYTPYKGSRATEFPVPEGGVDMDGLIGGDDSSAEILENGGVDENTESPEVVVDDEVIGDDQESTEVETLDSTDLTIGETISSKYAHPQDVVQIKGALAALGYYQPDEKMGMTPYFDTNLGEAIRLYQRDAGLPITGMMTPDGLEVSEINGRFRSYPGGADAAAKDTYKGSSFFDGTGNASPNQSLVFNGKTLAFYENGSKIKEWGGVSGRPGYQQAEHQAIKNKGPLPEGTYIAKQERYQDLRNKDDLVGAGSVLVSKTSFGLIPKIGTWPGGATSWGKQRVWLDPSVDANSFNRDNFSIHGGLVAGSAGCIDLTWQMPDFAKWYRQNGKDMIIHVKY